MNAKQIGEFPREQNNSKKINMYFFVRSIIFRVEKAWRSSLEQKHG